MSKENIFFPNTTQVPNFVFDVLMRKCGKTPTRFFVLLAIIRKTYGWQKHEDLLSLSQIIELTGMSKNAVKDALKFWQKEKVIKLLSKGDGRKISKYRCLLYDYIDSHGVIQEHAESQSVTPTESTNDTYRGQSVTPQNQLNQSSKTINKKEETSFPSQDRVTLFFEHHKKQLMQTRKHGDPDLHLVDKLGTLIEWDIDTYDKILKAKQNSTWEVRRNQPNTAKWLLAAMENENLESTKSNVVTFPKYDLEELRKEGFI